MKHLIAGALGLMLLTSAAFAQFSVLVDEASITALTGGDAGPEDIAVDGSGNVIVVDEGVSGNEMVLRFDSAGGNGVLITDEQSIIAAIDAANGAFGAPSAFTINSVFVAADGDIVLTNGDGGAIESVVTVTNAASPAAVVTVVSTAVSPGTAVSPVEGATASTVIGNICYVAVNGAFGAAEDAILAIDTNSGSAPAAPATTVVGEAAIEAATGASGGGANMGPLTNDGTDIWVADSSGGGTSDDIWSVTTGGVITLQIAATDTEADLGASDVGYTGMTIAGDGAVWAANGFGSGTGDDGILKFTGITGGGADTFLFDEATIDADISGGGAVQAARMAFSATTNSVLFANQGGSAEGIVTISQTVPVELSVFSAE